MVIIGYCSRIPAIPAQDIPQFAVQDMPFTNGNIKDIIS